MYVLVIVYGFQYEQFSGNRSGNRSIFVQISLSFDINLNH